MPTRYTSSADTHAMVARIAPSILELLGDGIPRSRRAFVAALADRYPKEEVELTLMRLAVTGQILAPTASTLYHRPPSQSRAEPKTGAQDAEIASRGYPVVTHGGISPR